MNCPYCHETHPESFSFCPRTGRKIEGIEIDAGSREVVAALEALASGKVGALVVSEASSGQFVQFAGLDGILFDLPAWNLSKDQRARFEALAAEFGAVHRNEIGPGRFTYQLGFRKEAFQAGRFADRYFREVHLIGRPSYAIERME